MPTVNEIIVYQNPVTDGRGSKPNQKYARRRDRQNYIRKNKVKLRTSSKRISLCVQYIGTLWGCGIQGYWCYVYDCVCHAGRCGLLLAKGCEPIAALTHCKQKHPLKLSVHINRTAVYSWSRGRPKSQPKELGSEAILAWHLCEEVGRESGTVI